MAKASAQPTTATAGYDLTFTPVKSVSTLWAVAPTDVAAAIEACHDQVVAETMQDGPQTTRFSRRPIHSSVRSACWVGAGTELAWGC